MFRTPLLVGLLTLSLSFASAQDILTPPSPKTPLLHNAKVFGSHPGNPFLFTIPSTGDRPITFSADNLPTGLTLDAATGRITGTTPAAGDYSVTLHAKNSLGENSRPFLIKSGDTLALTPPMGWNSWNCFANAVSDEKIRSAADAIVKTGLVDHGWTYVNIDDCWQGNRDASGNIQPNAKFPDMKALSDYIHGLGLKFGTYSSPGPKTCAGFTASYQHEDQDAATYGQWGVDYVKYDWCSYGGVAEREKMDEYGKLLSADDATQLKSLMAEKDTLKHNRSRTDAENARLKEVSDSIDALNKKMDPAQKEKIDLEIVQKPYKVFRASLDKVKRDIVFSYCQYGMGKVWEWGAVAGGNTWRTTGDITDNWNSMTGNARRGDGIAEFAGPGHWNDQDMLVVGQVGWGNTHPTKLTPDEQYTHMSLWCLQDCPLLIGCDLTKLDPFTLNLLTNDEVLDVDQDPLGQAASVVHPVEFGQTSIQIWSKKMQDGSTVVGLLNMGSTPVVGQVQWTDLKLSGSQKVRDLWRQKDLGSFDKSYATPDPIPTHGVVLIKISG